MKPTMIMAIPRITRNTAGARSGLAFVGLRVEGMPPMIPTLSNQRPTPIRMDSIPAKTQPITTTALPRRRANTFTFSPPQDKPTLNNRLEDNGEAPCAESATSVSMRQRVSTSADTVGGHSARPIGLLPTTNALDGKKSNPNNSRKASLDTNSLDMTTKRLGGSPLLWIRLLSRGVEGSSSKRRTLHLRRWRVSFPLRRLNPLSLITIRRGMDSLKMGERRSVSDSGNPSASSEVHVPTLDSETNLERVP
jgi:hypothetical protein